MTTFGYKGEARWNLLQYDNKADLIAAIKNLSHAYEATNQADGMRQTRMQIFMPPGDRPDIPNKVVMITDGNPTKEQGQTILEATRLNICDALLYNTLRYTAILG